MSNYNFVCLMGNLTKDPDLKYTASGTPVCNITLAINSFFKDKQGEKKENAIFVPITVWGKQAETSAEYLKKGRGVLIDGRLNQEKWEDKDGTKRSRITVTASQVRFLGTNPKGKDETKAPESGAAQEDENIPF